MNGAVVKNGIRYCVPLEGSNLPLLAVLDKEFEADENIKKLATELASLNLNWSTIKGVQGRARQSNQSDDIVSGNCFISGSIFFMQVINKGYTCKLVTAVFNHDEVEGTDLHYKTHHCFIEKSFGSQKYVINVSNMQKDPLKIYRLKTYMNANNFGTKDYIQSFTPQQFKKHLHKVLPKALSIMKTADLDTSLDVYQHGVRPVLHKTMEAVRKYEGW